MPLVCRTEIQKNIHQLHKSCNIKSMLSHIDNLSRVPQPDISNYFIQFTLVSLSGPRDPKSFKVALFKGLQPTDSTKQPFAIKAGQLSFEQASLELMMYSFNVKRPNNADISLVLYEVDTRGEEKEIGTVRYQVAELVGKYLEKGSLLKLEKNEKVGAYQLQYIVYVDKNKYNVQNQRQGVTPTKNQQAPQTQVGVSGKMRPIDDKEVADIVARTPEKKPSANKGGINIVSGEKDKKKEDSNSLSLLDVTGQHLLEEIIKKAVIEEQQQKSERVDKKEIAIRKTFSQNADTLANQLGKKKDKSPEKVQAEQIAQGNNKLIVIIITIVFLIYWFFIRGKSQKPAKPLKNQVKNPVKKPKKKN